MTVGDHHAARVIRLHPLRVMIAARDERFARVTTFLLGRDGYEVFNTERARAVETAARTAADVVVLETDTSRGMSARTIAALQALPTAPGIVAVFSGDANVLSDWVPAVEKWTPIDVLIREIEVAALHRAAPLEQRARCSDEAFMD